MVGGEFLSHVRICKFRFDKFSITNIMGSNRYAAPIGCVLVVTDNDCSQGLTSPGSLNVLNTSYGEPPYLYARWYFDSHSIKSQLSC